MKVDASLVQRGVQDGLAVGVARGNNRRTNEQPQTSMSKRNRRDKTKAATGGENKQERAKMRASGQSTTTANKEKTTMLNRNRSAG